MPKSGAPLVDVLEYCKSFELRLDSTRLKIIEVQDSWHSRTVAFQDVLKLRNVSSRMV